MVCDDILLTRGLWRTMPQRAVCRTVFPGGLWASWWRGLCTPRVLGRAGHPGCVATLPPQPGGLWLSEGGKFNFYKINSIRAIFLAECGSNNRPLIEKGN